MGHTAIMKVCVVCRVMGLTAIMNGCVSACVGVCCVGRTAIMKVCVLCIG